MKRLNAGVVGTGFWGENQVRVFRQSRACNLVGICDTDEKRAREVATKYEVEPFTDVEKFLRIPGLQVVTVCTPTHTHLDVATRVLETGKDVLVEKPMTGNAADAEKLVQISKKTGRKLLVGFIERFNPGVRLVKKMLEEKIVGEIIVATGRRVARWPVRIGDVGVVKDTAIHDIDVMRYLFDEEVSAVYAQTGSLKHSFEDYAEIMLRFDEGTTGFIDANWLTPRKARTLIITGSEATINLDYITQEISVEDSDKLTKPHPKWDEPLRLELEHFLQVVKDDIDPHPNGEDALEAIHVCEAALKSGKIRQLVQMPTDRTLS